MRRGCHARASKATDSAAAGRPEATLQQAAHPLPITPVPSALLAPPVPTRHTFHHRGFSLEIRRAPAGFAFTIRQGADALHASRADFATAVSADRAARRFVDDALFSFEFATQALEA